MDTNKEPKKEKAENSEPIAKGKGKIAEPTHGIHGLPPSYYRKGKKGDDIYYG